MFSTHEHAKQTEKGRASNSPFFQAKLTINQPNDTYEQEADAMVDRVMRMPDPSSTSFFSPSSGSIQRKHHGPDELEEKLHRKEVSSIQRKCQHCEEEDKKVHRKEISGLQTHVLEGLDQYIGLLGSSGQPLPASSRQFFEPRFGQDFSNVRVHTDSVAAKSAQSINALAYTSGNHIVFNQGQYSPESALGQKLMAHELTHVVQQGNTVQRKRKHKQLPCAFGSKVPSSVRFHFIVNTANFVKGEEDKLRGTLSGADPSAPIDVLGLASSDGPADLNEELSCERAMAVASVVESMGLIVGKIEATGSYPNTNGDNEYRAASIDYAGGQSPAPPMPTTQYIACFDGHTVYAIKNGKFASCGAVTGNIGDPTPDGKYCIRFQGETERDHFYNNKAKWYLIEPQFSTSRCRMHLHPGSRSSGCVSVGDEDCFDRLAQVINGSGMESGVGRDGYTPGGNCDAVNDERPVSCEGFLLVTASPGGCDFIKNNQGIHYD